MYSINWSKENHHLFDISLKKQIFTIMILTIKKDEKGKLKYSSSIINTLPKDILFIIFNFLTFDQFQFK